MKDLRGRTFPFNLSAEKCFTLPMHREIKLCSGAWNFPLMLKYHSAIAVTRLAHAKHHHVAVSHLGVVNGSSCMLVKVQLNNCFPVFLQLWPAQFFNFSILTPLATPQIHQIRCILWCDHLVQLILKWSSVVIYVLWNPLTQSLCRNRMWFPSWNEARLHCGELQLAARKCSSLWVSRRVLQQRRKVLILHCKWNVGTCHFKL